jgi:hypothetical protein
MKTHTFQTVADLLQENWESDLPDKVMEALRPFDGKMVTTRMLEKLPGGKGQWVLERAYGMTHIKNRDYWMTHGNAKNGVSLLLGHTEASFPFEWAKLAEKNPAYFSGRKERNHARMGARNTKDLLDRMAAAMNRVERANLELEAARKEFEELAGYGQPFAPDRYRLEDECGLISDYHMNKIKRDKAA